jgi:hypothetical protein
MSSLEPMKSSQAISGTNAELVSDILETVSLHHQGLV